MADTLKSLIDSSVQTEINNVVNSLKQLKELITQISANPVQFPPGSYSGQRKAIDEVTTANNNLAQAQKNVYSSVQQLIETQNRGQVSTAVSTAKIAAMTENSKLLKQALDDVKKQLQDGTAAGKLSADQQERFANQTQVLTTLVNQQQKGFSSLTMEIRAGERALQTMREAGLQNTTEFKAMQLATAETRREFNNFAKEQKILSSEAPAVQALTVAARGLGGAYAAGAGAAALFGDENGKIEKEFKQLMAVMTMLKGITELNEAIQQKNAIATSVGVMWNKLLVKVYGEKNVALARGTVLESENAIAAESGAAAMQSEAIGAGEAAAGVTALEIAMSAGLLLVIGAVIAGVVWLVKEIYNWVNADELAIEASNKLADANGKLLEATKARAEIDKTAHEARKTAMEQELSLAEKQGKNQYEIMAIKKKMAEDDLKYNTAMVEKYHITEGSLKSLENKWTKAADGAQKYNEQITALTAAGEKPSHLLEEQAENANKLADRFKNAYLFQQAFYDGAQKASGDIKDINAEKEKLSAEEQIKYNTEVAKNKIEANIHANEVILNEEKSTQAQRLQAEKNITADKIKLIRAEESERLKDPSLTPMGKATIEEAANAAVAKARVEGKEKLQKINEDYAKRDLVAYYQIRNAELEKQKEHDKSMYEEYATAFTQRIKVRTDEIRIDLELENNRYEQQKKKAGLSKKELQAIEAEHNTKIYEINEKGKKDLSALNDEAQKKQIENLNKWLDIQTKNQKQDNTNSDNSRIKEQSEAYSALADQYLRGAISAEKYEKAKDKLTDKFVLDNIKAEIEEQKELGATYIQDSDERKASDSKISVLEKQLREEKIKQDDKAIAKKKEQVDKVVNYEIKGAQVVQAIIDGQFERRKNQIQHEIDLIDQRKEAEIAAVNASTLNQQQKAAQMMVFEQTAAAQKERLQRQQKQEDIKKAQFDKEAALFEAVINLAADIIKLGVISPKAILAEAAGLAQIAVIAARPIPKYSEGTPYHPGGWALVGEEYKPELVQAGGKSFMVDKPTYLDLPRGATVTPEDELKNQLIARSLKSFGITDKLTQPDNSKDLQMIAHGLTKVEKAIKKQKIQTHIYPPNPEWQAYIDKQVRN